MQYAITGHTSGIGKALYEKLAPSCIGFSRSTGYDISLSVDRHQILKELVHCDVLINNAFDGFAQTQLLLEFWQTYQNEPKIIINVGSQITEISADLAASQELLRYRTCKIALKTLAQDLQSIPSILTVQYKSFGYVGTPAILQKYPNFTKDDYITVDNAVDIILEAQWKN